VQGREDLVVDQVHHALRVAASGRHRKDRVVLRHDETELPIGTVSAEEARLTAPELVAITHLPVAQGIAAVGDLLRGRGLYPRGRHQLLAVPHSLLEEHLAEARDVLGADDEARGAQVDALLGHLPVRIAEPERIKEPALEVVVFVLAGDLLDDRRLDESARRVVYEEGAGLVADRQREELADR
jgi:hypothetical protein